MHQKYARDSARESALTVHNAKVMFISYVSLVRVLLQHMSPVANKITFPKLLISAVQEVMLKT